MWRIKCPIIRQRGYMVRRSVRKTRLCHAEQRISIELFDELCQYLIGRQNRIQDYSKMTVRTCGPADCPVEFVHCRRCPDPHDLQIGNCREFYAAGYHHSSQARGIAQPGIARQRLEVLSKFLAAKFRRR